MAKPSKKSAPPKKAAPPKPGSRNGKKPEAAKPVPKAAAPKAKPEPPAPKVSKAEAELMGKILHLISEDMTIEEAELTPNASFQEDLGIDQIDVAELLMQAEGEFGLHPFSEADWDKCQTVDDFVQLVMKRVEAKRGRRK